MTTYTIPQKSSNTGSIYDLASDMFDRDIKFSAGYQFAVVNAAYYGGKGYTTHRTESAAIAASKRNDYNHQIIDTLGNIYAVDPNQGLIKLND